MKMKILPIIFAMVASISLFIIPVSASVEIELPIDVTELYTDINYLDETNVYGEVVTEDDEKELDTKKHIYIAILCVLFVVALIILIVTVKRAKDDKLFPEDTSSESRE